MKLQHKDDLIRVAMLADFPYRQDDLYRGGVMQANYRLVQALAAADGVDLHVWTPTIKTKVKESRQVGNGTVTYFPLPNQGYGVGVLYYGLRRVVNELVNEVEPDLLHAQGHPSYIFTALQCKLPVLVTIHGIYRNELPVSKVRKSVRNSFSDRLVSKIEDYNCAKISNLIAITRQIEDWVRARSPRARIFRMNNAIDEQFFNLENRNSKPVILFVGWVTHRKGVHLLAEAFQSILPTVQDAELRIVGLDAVDLEYGRSLRTQYARLIEAKQMVFLGGINQDQLYEEMSECAVLCLPSLAESAPMVIAQAMAAGKPVIATRVGGVPEMVEEGLTGRLCEPDDPDQLALCLLDVLRDQSMRREMGKRARAVAVQRYRADSVAQSTLNAYCAVLGR